jgi:hypothetical protein
MTEQILFLILIELGAISLGIAALCFGWWLAGVFDRRK